MLKTNFQKGMFTILVEPAAWHMFAIFVATIIGFILHPIPIGGVALIAVGLTGFLKVLKPAEALSGFGNATIWLIVGAYMFAKGFIKTGLGRRIAYVIMSQIATSSLKLGYSLAITDFIVSPATPSNTARGGGILYPIVRSLCTAFQSEPDDGTRKRIGNYLMLSTFECDCITSSLFLTSKDVTGLDITWGTYALATILPGIIALIITPYLVYKLATPELTQTPEAPQLAKDELQKMGPMSSAETTVLIAFLAALAMWATTSFTGLNATMIALVCIGFMLVRGALEWNDIITEKGAWDTLVWMGGLMSLATGLAKLGFVKWIATGISGSLKGIDPMTTLLILCLINMYVHYAFASLSAHVSAVYAAFLAVAVAAGAPPMLSAIALGVETGIMGCLTHYATGPAPIYFGSGYITQPEWWKVGFVCSILFLICFLGIGPMWWKMVGLW